MSYYRTCPHCGANLDPGERCGCREEQAQKKAPVSVTSTDRGVVDQISTSVSKPSIAETTGFVNGQ